MPQYLSPGVYVEEVPSAVRPIAGVGTSTAGFIGVVPDALTIPRPNRDFDPTQPVADANQPFVTETFDVPIGPAEARLCTTFGDFTRFFGDFSTDAGQRNLAHAVYGFFNGGGSRCYVTRVAAAGDTATALRTLEAIDEIAIVAAPGITTAAARTAIVTTARRSRTASRSSMCPRRRDGRRVRPDPARPVERRQYPAGQHGLRGPLLSVDPGLRPGDEHSGSHRIRLVYVPPSGHVAGIYARVDTERGVHKAPANETVRGALGLRYAISAAGRMGSTRRASTPSAT